MKFSANDLKVASAARMDARAPAAQIAALAGVRTETARRIIAKLVSRNILVPFLIVNPNSFGVIDYCIFFNCGGSRGSSRKKIVDFCQKSSHVAYCSELIGEYQFTLSLFSKNIYSLEQTIRMLSEELGIDTFSIAFAIRLEWSVKNGGAFRDNKKKIITRGNASRVEIDPVDDLLLRTVSSEPSISFVALGKRLKLTEGAVRTRYKKLLTSGVIVGTPYRVDYAQLGLTSYRVVIQVRQRSAVLTDNLRKFAFNNPLVSEFVQCLGAWDYEMNFEVSNPELVSDLVQEIYNQFGSVVHSIKTMSDLKVHFINQYAFS